MSENFEEFHAAFFEEAAEHIGYMEQGLLQLETSPEDRDLLNRIFRSAHSIKGGAGMFGFTTVSEFTHKVENLLDRMRNGQIAATPHVMTLLLEATDGIKGLLEATQGRQPADEAPFIAMKTKIETVLAGGSNGKTEAPAAPAPPTPVQEAAPRVEEKPAPAPKAPDKAAPTTYEIRWAPPRDMFRRGLDPLLVFRELAGLGEITDLACDESQLPGLAEMDPESCYLSWSWHLTTTKSPKDIEAVFEFVRDGSVLLIQDRQTTKREAGASEDGGSRPEPPTLKTRSLTLSPQTSSLCEASGEHKRLGEILVEEKVISAEALNEALSRQKRIGEILVEEKSATSQQVAKALDKQQQQDAASSSKKVESASIRVDTAKLDKLINLVGELVITQSMLSSLGARFDMSRLPLLLERVAQLEGNTRELQERVMAIRMLPVGNAFNRFPRLVRDLASKNGKKLQLVLSGEETELDKTVIESIGDPLTHLVRNSADHGLEPPEERAAAGKPEQGTIRMNAFHEGGNICITVEDDGRGLNREKILAKARKQGLVAESETPSDEQIWPLIFKPGFSTADKVTDVSGRGVGMDVVKRNIETLGGVVSIRTAQGTGTTFTLKLPLILAIVEGMTVRVGKELYIIPLVSIVESIQPKDCKRSTIAEQAEMVNVRGQFLPVVRLYDVFGIEPEFRDLDKTILVIVETEGERVAVMVDELVGQQQVVIKSLEKNFQKVAGIAGATILGDGTVGFILDVRGLLDLSRRAAAAA